MKIISNRNKPPILSNILYGSKQSIKRPPCHKNGEKFIKGPIPLDWMIIAASLPGSAVKIALALWFLAGLTNSGTVKLSNKLANKLGVSRKAKYLALKHLTNAGLITVKKKLGCSPQVTILEIK